jgi:hypothetical protein
MEIKKPTIAILTSTIILLSILGSALLIVKADVTEWYASQTGVLDSDYYSLYPYEKSKLTIGFSQFGEMINPYTGHGLNYSGRDPFANEGILKKYWLNGWFIDIRYIHRVEGARHLWAMATFADMISYGGDWYNGHTDPYGAPHGGRKCSGNATTDPITVLYDGPRRYIALVTTHLNDTVGDDTWPVLDVTFTIIFNRVDKEVIVLKNIKLTIDSKILESPIDVQFSNRGEWDLGPSPDWKSYAHFYHQEFTTCYGADWTLSKNITREEHYLNNSFTGSSLTLPYESARSGTYYGLPVVWRSDYVYVNDVWKKPGTDYNINYDTGVITFSQAITAKKVEIFYKLYKKEGILQGFSTDTYQGDAYTGAVIATPHEYDLAQIIARDKTVVGYAAFWPVLSDYTVDGWDRALEALYNVSESDMVPSGSEPDIPYVVGEWDFMLDYDISTPNWGQQFRGVTVYGLVNYHDADDYQYNDLNGDGVRENQVDREAQYQLNMIFNPWDLNDAVEKQEYRWLFKDTIADETNQVPLTRGLGDSLYYAVLQSEYESLGETEPTWTGYFLKDSGTYPTESEWVNLLEDNITAYSKNWALKMNGSEGWEMLKITPTVGTPTATAPLTLQLKDLVDFGFWYKFISGTQGPHIQIKVYSDPRGGESYNWANIMAENTNTQKSTTTWTHYTLNTIENFIDGHTSDTAFCLTGQSGTGLPTSQFHSFEYWSSKLGDYYVGSIGIQVNAACVALVDDLSVAYLDRHSGIRYERVYNMEEDKLIPCEWDAYCTPAEKVLVDGTLIARYGYQDLDPIRATTGVHRPYYTINWLNGTLEFHKWSATLQHYITWNLFGSEVKVLYSTIEENERGAYEWTVLGRDAYTSDSLGATLVTAAFKNKDIEIGIAGEDMMSTDWGLSSIPYVLNCFGTEPGARADYKDDGTTPGNRLALKDDWCTTWPITSSNMIMVGGPLANMLTSYFNEFTDAFWGTYTPFYGESYTPYEPWQNRVVALTCWNGTIEGYEASVDTGYGVITTYKDINGTIGLAIWGIGPRDTFYTSKFFHEEIIYELQEFPCCVTSIILKIDYTDSKHPTFTVVECLGTISETTVELVKGGIHPDP